MGTRADRREHSRRRATTTFGAEKKNAANGIKTLSRRNVSTRRVFRRRVIDETRLASSSARARAPGPPRARAGPSVYASTTAMASISTSAPRGKPFASIVARAGEFSGNRFP